jgi:hypothetical protein
MSNTIIKIPQELMPVIDSEMSIIPVKEGDKTPLVSWSEYQQRPPSNDELEDWHSEHPNANWAVVTGETSGVVIVDVDGPIGAVLIDAFDLEQTPCVTTQKGTHHYFRYSSDQRITNRGRILPDIDIRADGGYAIIPPSTHPSGSNYEWKISLDEQPLAGVPDWLDFLLNNPYAQTALKDELECFANTEKGRRNDQLNRSAFNLGQLVAGGIIPQLMVEKTLFAVANHIGLEEGEISTTIQSGLASGKRSPRESTSDADIQTPASANDNHVKNAAIVAVDVADFVKVEIPEREYVLSPWLPEKGIAMLGAERGVGKTHVALSIAHAVATGGTLFDWQAPKPRGVLLIDGEMPMETMQDRLKAIIAGTGVSPESGFFKLITPDFQESGMPDLSTPEGQASIEPHLENVGLVVADNISTLCRTGEENAAEGWLPSQDWSLSLRRRGISLVWVHHTGRNGNMRGTSKREDILDTVILLEKPTGYKPEEGARFKVTYLKNRGFMGDDASSFETQYSVDDGKANWVCRPTNYDMEVAQIAELVNNNPGISLRKIEDEIGFGKNKAGRLRNEAKSRGLICS